MKKCPECNYYEIYNFDTRCDYCFRLSEFLRKYGDNVFAIYDYDETYHKIVLFVLETDKNELKKPDVSLLNVENNGCLYVRPIIQNLNIILIPPHRNNYFKKFENIPIYTLLKSKQNGNL